MIKLVESMVIVLLQLQLYRWQIKEFVQRVSKVNHPHQLNLPMCNALTMCDHVLTQVARQLFIEPEYGKSKEI